MIGAADPEAAATAERRRRAAVERQQRRRAREAQGLIVLPIEVDENIVADALIDAGILGEKESADRGRVAEALAAVITEWAKTSRHA